MNIGLTQRIFYHKQRSYDSLEHGWYSFLDGHNLVPIANNIDQDFKKIAESLDLLIITGGNDPTPRRITETKLATEVMKLKKPILGICHGAFLLTDLLGGTIEDCSYHMDTEHLVTTRDGVHTVNSYHDYQISKPHNTATVLARDIEGNCEAWIDGTLAGVVWHPERMEIPFLPKEIVSLIKL
jgi:gamma-glutamyl-gamma-aminobutyrate hydrolase PuuD